MTHLAAMLDRLPILYREGTLVAQALSIPALMLEILDQDGLEVQRAHWFDSALELTEAARLAAVVDIPAESWQDLAEYRVWVHSLRDTLFQRGAVTTGAIQDFIVKYAGQYQQTAEILAVPDLKTWEYPSAGPTPARPDYTKPLFIENPLRRRGQRIPSAGGIEPLWQFSVENKGLDPACLDVLMAGLESGPESVPVLINLTTGEALLFLGNVPPGQRLWINGQADGSVSARLELQDVTGAMRSVTGVIPGAPWENSQVQSPARALQLRPGRNDLWFLPVAHFDALGIDRFLLALADIALRQGRFDATSFDHALFYQDPGATLDLSWVETTPASFRIELPGGALRTGSGRASTGAASRGELGASLDLAVSKLRGTGIFSSVELAPFRERQPQMDYLTAVLPQVLRETAPTGADRMRDAGGVFGVTQFDESTFR